MYPLRERMRPLSAAILVLVGYMISILLSSPIGIFAEYVDVQHIDLQLDRRYCTENWPSSLYRKLYATSTVILHFVIPLTLITVLYILVFQKLQGRVKRRNRFTERGRQSRQNGSGAPTTSNNRTTKMLVAVVLVFAVSWCPYHLYALIAELSYDHVRGRYFKFIDVILRGVAVSSACINPFLYGWYNDNYRTSFYCICSRVCGVKVEGSRLPDGTDNTGKSNSGATSKMISRFKDSIRTTSMRITSWRRNGSDKSAFEEGEIEVPPPKRPIGRISSVPYSSSSTGSRNSRRSRFARSVSPGSRSRVEPYSPGYDLQQSYDRPPSYQNYDQDSPTNNVSVNNLSVPNDVIQYDDDSSSSSIEQPIEHINVNVNINNPATERTPLNPRLSS